MKPQKPKRTHDLFRYCRYCLRVFSWSPGRKRALRHTAHAYRECSVASKSANALGARARPSRQCRARSRAETSAMPTPPSRIIHCWSGPRCASVRDCREAAPRADSTPARTHSPRSPQTHQWASVCLPILMHRCCSTALMYSFAQRADTKVRTTLLAAQGRSTGPLRLAGPHSLQSRCAGPSTGAR